MFFDISVYDVFFHRIRIFFAILCLVMELNSGTFRFLYSQRLFLTSVCFLHHPMFQEYRSKNIHKYFSLEAPERVLFALFVYRPRTKTGYLFKPQKRYHFCVFPAIHRKFPARKYNLLGFRKLGNTLEFLCYLVIIELPNYCFITTYSCIMSLYR